MKRVLLVLFMTFLTVNVFSYEKINIVRIVDGDELIVMIDGNEERRKIWGIAAPSEGDYFYDESKAGLKMILEHHNISYAYTDPSYKGMVSIGDAIPRALVSAGYCFMDGNMLFLQQSQRAAKTEKLGVWKNK